jgi:TRAP-type C4-dicarboxylate transport system permease small subunit
MSSDNSKNINDVKYQTYIEERRSLIEASRVSAEQFDKYILTLSTGALALSITFLKNIAPVPQTDTIVFLVLSWLCLIICALLTLVSFLTSQKACSIQIEILEKNYLPDEKPVDSKNQMSSFTIWLNRLSIFFFIIGVSLLAIFSIKNINHQTGITQMAQKKPQQIDEGFVPPKTPAQPKLQKKGYVPPPPPKKPKNTDKSGK